MIKVRLKGGMGNQMFQYAFGQSMSHKLGTQVQYDLSSLLHRRKEKDFVYRDYDLDIFELEADFDLNYSIIKTLHDLKIGIVSAQIMKYVKRKNELFKERFFHFDEELYTSPKDEVLYDGWWQSHKYFGHLEKDIRAKFTFRNPILPSSSTISQAIASKESVCLNVRRTDFLKNDVLNSTDLGYFLRGVEYFQSQLNSPHFFIFSDDIKWCQEKFNKIKEKTIVDHSHKGRKFGNYLQLMKKCKHFIIPNSSFAYWAAYLSESPDKIVVAPERWFTSLDIITSDLVHENWIRL